MQKLTCLTPEQIQKLYKFIYYIGLKLCSLCLNFVIRLSSINIWWLPLTQKIFMQPIPEISWLLVEDTHMKFFSSTNFVYTLWHHFWDTQYKHIFLIFCHLLKKSLGNPYLKTWFYPLSQHFRDTKYKIIFLLQSKKIFLQTLVEIILKYQKKM